MEIKGDKKLLKSFDKASKIADQYPTTVKLEELLTDSFISKNSKFQNLSEFINKS
ncbi:hypothetical protein ACQV2R_05155 [Facklamia sp. P12937]|uniref:hypothetical protein n=1 Tax=Facklamia sp. P12937 TaxID=3421949 RepID=UPI003D16DB30